MIIEEWRPIIGWPYSISNYGRIRNDRTGRLRKPAVHRGGYLQVHLRDGKRSWWPKIHRLVAVAFLPTGDGELDVNHINGDKTDNRIDNLEWCSKRENQIHKYRVLGITPNTKNASTSRSKPVRCIETGAVYPSRRAASRDTGINHCSINMCVCGKLKTAGNLHWEAA